MRSNEEKYFKYLVNRISDNGQWRGRSYIQLLQYLASKSFYALMRLDENREGWGLYLRTNVDYDIQGPCSMLEMLIGLASRIEEVHLYDWDIGDQTPVWFWTMIQNLGLINQTDARFNYRKVDDIVCRFLNREYAPNGKGGLFVIEDDTVDLRDLTIWQQVQEWLRERGSRSGWYERMDALSDLSETNEVTEVY